MKHCTTCKTNQPDENFHKNKITRDGLSHQCKSCVLAYQRANKDKFKVNREKYELANREKELKRKREYSRRRRAEIKESVGAEIKADAGAEKDAILTS